jgi:hypothetical protein
MVTATERMKYRLLEFVDLEGRYKRFAYFLSELFLILFLPMLFGCIFVIVDLLSWNFWVVGPILVMMIAYWFGNAASKNADGNKEKKA